MPDHKVTWTLQQRQAIEARDCDVLVSAAAGAGKTAVLVERITRRLLDESRPVDIDRLLVVTFTEAAAAEMRQRIGQALEEKLQQTLDNQHLQQQLARLPRAAISTIHSFCSRLLRRYFYRLGLDPDFRVMDEKETALLRYETVDRVLERRYELRDEELEKLVDQYGGRNGDEAIKQLILHLYEFQTSLPQPEQWQADMLAMFHSCRGDKFDSLPWVRTILHMTEREIARAEEMLARAYSLCHKPGGPARYAEILAGHREMVAGIRKIMRGGQWDAIAQSFGEFKRLPPIRTTPEMDEALKEQAKKLNNDAREIVKDVQKKYFQRSAEDLAQEAYRLAPTAELLFDLLNSFTAAYAAVKQRRAVLDFADLERFALKLLTERGADGSLQPSDIAREVRRRFDEVLVDEYQDTNGVQDCILAMVARNSGEDSATGNRFMVGDIKQSIYGFRLTDPGLFLAKYQSFSRREGAKQRRIDLMANFRSRREIVWGINFIFRQLMTPGLAGVAYDEKTELKYAAEYPPLPFQSDADKPSDPRLEFYLLERQKDGQGMPSGDDNSDEEELEPLEREARLIAGRIRQLVGDPATGAGRGTLVWDKDRNEYRPARYRDIVVLLRSLRGRANQVLDVFRQMGIPAYADLSSGYFDSVEIKVMLSLLQILDNPRQDIPLAAVLRSPIVNLSAEELAQIRLADRTGEYYDAVQAAARQPGDLGKKLTAFLHKLEQWRTAARRLPLGQLVWYLYRETGFYDFAGAMPRGRQRQANLRGLHDRAREFDGFAGQGLFRFNRFMERLQEQEEDLGEARTLGEGENVVRIMSIHKSKGLEFPIVFLADLGKKFNEQDHQGDILLHKDLGLGLYVVDPQAQIKYPSLAHMAVKERLRLDALAEEMRILYVAMTRARERLILVGSQKDLPGTCEKWMAELTTEKWSLSDRSLTRAKCYLDWLGPALARHRQGGALRTCGSAGCEPVNTDVAADPSSWEIWVEGVTEVPQWMFPARVEDRADGIPWEKLRRLEPVGVATLTPERKAYYIQKLLWRYPGAELAHLPAKVSVTELQQLAFPPGTGLEAKRQGTAGQAFITRRPRFVLAGRNRISAAERGSLTHLVLQHLDLSQNLREKDILAREMERLIEEKFLTEEQMAAVDIAAIEAFFQSPLGRRLLKNPSNVEREIPFTLRLSAREVYGASLPAAPAMGGHPRAPATRAGKDNLQSRLDEEYVIVQGIIDCLVAESGGFLLLDFKTDQVSRASVCRVAAHYEEQMRQYVRAIETIRHLPVQEAYLYFFSARAAIRIGDECDFKKIQ